MFLFGTLGGGWLALPYLLSGRPKLPSWVLALSPVYGVVLLLLSLVFVVLARRQQGLGVKAITTLTVLSIVVLQAGILDVAAEIYDIKPLSTYLAKVQEKGYPIANTAKYEAQYQFFGRLRKPLEVITEDDVSGWLASHPSGRVVRYFRQWPQETGQKVEFTQPFRGKFAVVVASGDPP